MVPVRQQNILSYLIRYSIKLLIDYRLTSCCFFALQGIGDDDDTVVSSSLQLMETEEGFQPVFFEPRELRNLLLIDELESLCPIMDMKVRKPGCYIHFPCCQGSQPRTPWYQSSQPDIPWYQGSQPQNPNFIPKPKYVSPKP